MANKLDIVNSGLVLCGQSTLQSLDENTADAALVNQVWDHVLTSVLREGVWSGATKRALLVNSPTAPIFGYTYAYETPADLIRLINCYDSNGNSMGDMEWHIEGSEILSDTSPLYVRYVCRPTTLDNIDPLLANTISLKLAITLAYTKTGDKILYTRLSEQYEAITLQRAQSIDSIENNELNQFREVSWLASRNC